MATTLSTLNIFFQATSGSFYKGQTTTTYSSGNQPSSDYAVSGDAATNPFDGMVVFGGAQLAGTVANGVITAIGGVNEPAPPPDDPNAYNQAGVTFNTNLDDSITVAQTTYVTFTPYFQGSLIGLGSGGYTFRLRDAASNGYTINDETGFVSGQADQPGPTTMILLAGHTYVTVLSLLIGISGLAKEASTQEGSAINVTAGFTVQELDVFQNPVAGNPDITFDSGFNHEDIVVACFAAGTRIATAAGEAAVEDLRVGDAVRTRAGTQDIVWIGRRRIDLARHPHPERARPVRILRDAFAPGVPARDLRLSPDHAVFWNGVLIEAKYLIDGSTVAQELVDAVSYFHVELARHDIVFAEGLSVESYLDTGNRGMFEGGHGALVLHPDFAAASRARGACAPMAFDGERLAAIRRHLLERAARLGFATTDDPGLYLLADGRRIDGATLFDGRRRFAIPRHAGEVRLRSRTGTPAHLLADTADGRLLGAFVGSLTVSAAAGTRRVTPGELALGEGWYAPEPEGIWTNGDARLELAGPCSIEITLAGSLPYPHRRRRAA